MQFNPANYILGICLLLICLQGHALNLPDRLDTPARFFPHVENSAFLDVLVVGKRLLSVGERGVIAFSEDNGLSWQQSNVPVSTMITSVSFVDDQHGWAAGHSAVILYTSDGGLNWSVQFDGNKANAALLREAKASLEEKKAEYAAATEEEQEDLLYEVEDAEFVLSNAEFDTELGPANPFLDIHFESLSKGYAVGAYGLFFVTEDGGKTWNSWANRLENFDRYHLNAVKSFSDGTLLVVGEAGSMFASYDNGEYWETLYGPYQGSYFGIEEINSSNEILVYGLKGSVYKSADQGQSWEQISVPANTSITDSAVDKQGRIFLTGFSGVLLVSKDQGNSFHKIKQTGLEAFNSVAALDQESKLILVSDHGVHFQPY